MSNLLGDAVFAMPPLSMRCAELLAEAVLKFFQPRALEVPEPVNMVEWIDKFFPPLGVHVMPASSAELGECAAATYPTGAYDSEILIQEWMWDDLAHDPKPNFARATVMHEVAHVILHVPVIRSLLQAPERDFALARVERDALPAFCDPEWQAWALAGAILVPRKSVAMLSDRSPQIVAETYRVSEKLAAVRLRRLGYQQETSALAGAVATEEG